MEDEVRTLGLILISVLLSTQVLAQKFILPPNTPLARGEHPRIFMTAKDIADLRTRINTYYKSDFQQFVNHMDSMYSMKPGTGDVSDWNDLTGTARSYALLYQVDPSTISGISARYTKEQYGRKAIEYGLYIANALPADWNEPHHGPATLSGKKGGVPTLALQVVYDWTHDLSSLAEKRTIVDRLIVLWNNRYARERVKLENHYTANTHVYGAALCFYGDEELGSSYMSKAKVMMDSFQDVFVESQIGVSDVLYEGSSDWHEGDSYSMDGYTGIQLLAAAAGSALNKNYWAEHGWLKYSPYYLYYNIMPMAYQGTYYFAQQNTSRALEGNAVPVSNIMNMAAAKLADVDPDLAGFAAWFAEQSPYGVDVDDYKYYEPHIYDFFYKFIFGTKHVRKKTPYEAEIPLSVKLGQSYVLRSDHEYDSSTLIQFFAQTYWYPNGHNEPEIGALNIHRFGPLAVSATNTKNAGDGIPSAQSDGKGMAQNNVFGIFSDKKLSENMGSIRMDDTDKPELYKEGANAHIGTTESWQVADDFDYINYNYTRSYKGGNNVKLARRAIVYLRGEVNQEYLVVLDRVDATGEKYFVLHTTMPAEVVDGQWNSAAAGWKTTGARTVSVTNRMDKAHGRMYVTSVLPKSGQFYMMSGRGKEWVWADGTSLNYNASDFGELAAFILSQSTLQVRSSENQFLTVMQLGDANTMSEPASVEDVSGGVYIGALMNRERLVLFSKNETPLQNFSYTITSNKPVKHFIGEMKRGYQYTVRKNGTVVANGVTGRDGTISFTDSPGGKTTYSVELGTPTSVRDGKHGLLPDKIELSNYPNPFNPETTISFTLPQQSTATLRIYNSAGQLVRTLLSEELGAGEHKVVWNGTSDSGRLVSSGVYFYRLDVDGVVVQRKLVLAK